MPSFSFDYDRYEFPPSATHPHVKLPQLCGAPHSWGNLSTASAGALWKCPAWGRPVNVALNLKVGEAGAPSPLEISRAIVADHACTGAARFPHSHSGRRR